MRSSFMSCSVHPLSLSLSLPGALAAPHLLSPTRSLVSSWVDTTTATTEAHSAPSLSLCLARSTVTPCDISASICVAVSSLIFLPSRSCVVINWEVITSAFGSSMFRYGCGFVTLWPFGRLVFVEEPIADVMTVCKKHARHARHWLSALLPQEPTSNSQAVLPTVLSTPFHQHPFIGKQCLMCLSIVPETKGQAKPTAANLQREQNS